MKTAFGIAVLGVLLAAPSQCFALGAKMTVSKEEAKGLGMEVRSEPAYGPNEVRVELELKTEGALKNFSGVQLVVGGEDNPSLTARLQEDRSKPGRVVVSFTTDRNQLDKLALCVSVVELGTQTYELRVKDFVEPKKDR